MTPRRPHARAATTALAVAALGWCLGACGATAQTAAPATTRSVGTLGVGVLPEELTSASVAVPPTLAPDPSAPPTSSLPELVLEPGAPPIAAGTVGNYADGNLVVLLGDSLIASTAPRFEGTMCAALEQFGWSAEIDAVTGRHVEYGEEVLDFRDAAGQADFDVAVVMLGNNYRGDYDDFTTRYDALLERLAPRPTVVVTLTETVADHSRINAWLRWRSYFRPNVVVVDWAEVTASDPDRLLAGDGLHLTDAGRDRLALLTVAALGAAPTTFASPTCTDNTA